MNHFKEAAKSWDKESTVNRNQVFAESILKHISSNKEKLSLLDFGCGTGLLSQFLIDRTSRVVGIDPTVEMLAQFDQKFEKYGFAKSYALNIETEAMPEEIGSFDVIVSAMAFHHLENPLASLGKLKKLLIYVIL